MRGTRTKRERRERDEREGITPGLKSIPGGDVTWDERPTISGARARLAWHRTTALIPNPVVEAIAEAKRKRRKERNLRVLGLA